MLYIILALIVLLVVSGDCLIKLYNMCCEYDWYEEELEKERNKNKKLIKEIEELKEIGA